MSVQGRSFSPCHRQAPSMPEPALTTPHSGGGAADASRAVGAWLVVAVCLPVGLYLATLTPTVLDGDAANFARQSYRLGLAHAPGYPLMGLLGKALTTAVAIGDPGWRANLLAVGAALACLLLVWLVARAWGVATEARGVAALALGLSPLFWSQAVAINPYIVQAAMVLGVVLLLEVWSDSGRLRWLVAAGVLYGAGLGGHPSHALYIPAIAAFVVARLWRRGARQVVLAGVVGGISAVLGYLPMLAYVVLYVSRQPASAGSEGLVGRLVDFLTASDSPSDWRRFFLGVWSVEYLKQLAGHVAATMSQLSPVGLLLAVIGAWVLARKRPSSATLVVLAYLAQTNFACTLRHWHHYDVYRLPTYVFLALLISVGLGEVAQRIEGRGRRLGACLALAVLMVGPPYLSLWVWRGGSVESTSPVARLVPRWPLRADFARGNYADCCEALRLVEPASTVVTTWGPFATLRYLQEVEGIGTKARIVAITVTVDGIRRALRSRGPGSAYLLLRGEPATPELRSLLEGCVVFQGAWHRMYRLPASVGIGAGPSGPISAAQGRERRKT